MLRRGQQRRALPSTVDRRRIERSNEAVTAAADPVIAALAMRVTGADAKARDTSTLGDGGTAEISGRADPDGRATSAWDPARSGSRQPAAGGSRSRRAATTRVDPHRRPEWISPKAPPKRSQAAALHVA
jgi:hypothetical protein